MTAGNIIPYGQRKKAAALHDEGRPPPDLFRRALACYHYFPAIRFIKSGKYLQYRAFAASAFPHDSNMFACFCAKRQIPDHPMAFIGKRNIVQTHCISSHNFSFHRSFPLSSRACLKIAFCQMCVTVCGNEFSDTLQHQLPLQPLDGCVKLPERGINARHILQESGNIS